MNCRNRQVPVQSIPEIPQPGIRVFEMNKKRVIECLKLKVLNIGMKAVCLRQDLVLEHDWIKKEITVFGS